MPSSGVTTSQNEFRKQENTTLLEKMNFQLGEHKLSKLSLSGTRSQIHSITIGFKEFAVTIYISDLSDIIYHKIKSLNIPDTAIQCIGKNLIQCIKGALNADDPNWTGQLKPLTEQLTSPQQGPQSKHELEKAKDIVGEKTSNTPIPSFFAQRRLETLHGNQKKANSQEDPLLSTTSDGQLLPVEQVAAGPPLHIHRKPPFDELRDILLTADKEHIRTKLKTINNVILSHIEELIGRINDINELYDLYSIVQNEHNNPLKETRPWSLGHAATFLHTNGLWAEFTTATEQKLIILLRDRVLELSKSQTFQTELASSSPVL